MALAVVRPIISFEGVRHSPNGDQLAISQTMPGRVRYGPWGFTVWPTGVPRGTKTKGSGLSGLGSNVTRTCELLPSRARRASGTLGPALGATCRGDTTLDKRLEHPVNSFVADCPKYATLSGSQATDSIIFERCVGV